MKTYLVNNKILIAVLCIGLLVSCISVGNRMSIENKNKSYDIVADYAEIEAMAEQTHKDTSYWLKQYRDEMNINKIGLAEENLMTLMESSDVAVEAEVMDIITKKADWKEKYPAEVVQALSDYKFDSYDVLIKTGDKAASDFIIDSVKKRFEKDMYVAIRSGDKAYVLIDGKPENGLYSQKYKIANSKTGGFTERTDLISSKIMYISLGFIPEKVEKIQSMGMEIIPRTLAYNGFNGTKYAKAVLNEYKKYNIEPQYMIVGGEGVIGFDDGIDFAEKYIEKNGITIGMIENTTQLQNILQRGVEQIAIDTGYKTVRVFSVWDYIQYRYKYYGYEGAKEIENTLFRAITERNIRVIYFKPIKENKDMFTYVTDVKEYKEMFENLNTRLSEHGITYGDASVMPDYNVSLPLKLCMGFGGVSALILLLGAFLPLGKKENLVLGTVGGLGVLAAHFVMPNSVVLLMSFGAAVVFACLAISFFVAKSRTYRDNFDKNAGIITILKLGAETLIVSVLIALLGGIMTAAPISDTSFMLEIDIFRGVKLAQLLPIAYFAVAYLAYFGFGETKKKCGVLEIHDLKDMLNTYIKIWVVIVAVLIGGVGVYYIMRTGHDSSVEVSNMEMLFRNYLEDHLIARPRNKEFLFAFPAVMLMVYASVRRLRIWQIFFGLCGVIGMTSVNNTFMHIRTPLYLGFARTGFSLVFGLIVGIIGVAAFECAYKAYGKWGIPIINKYCG